MTEEQINRMNEYNAKPELDNIERTINLIEEKGFIPMDVLSIVEMDKHESYLNKLDSLSNLKKEIDEIEKLNESQHNELKQDVKNYFETIQNIIKNEKKWKNDETFKTFSLDQDFYDFKFRIYEELAIGNEEYYLEKQAKMINRQNEIKEEIRQIQEDDSKTYEQKKPEMMRLIGILKGANASVLAIANKQVEKTKGVKVDITKELIEKIMQALSNVNNQVLQMDLSPETKKNIFDIGLSLNNFKQKYYGNIAVIEGKENKNSMYQQLLSDMKLVEKDSKVKSSTMGDNAEEKARLEAEAKATKEAEEKARLEAEAKAAKEAEEKARLEAEAKATKEADEKARLVAEAKATKEAEEKARLEAEAKAAEEAEEKARLEAEAKATKEKEEQNNKKTPINGKAQFKALGETIHHGKGTKFIRRFSNVGLIASGIGIAINPPVALFAIVTFTTYKKYANWRDSVDVKTLPSKWSRIKSFIQYSVGKKSITTEEKAEVEEILANAENELEIKPQEDVLDEAVKSTAAQLAEEGLVGPQSSMQNEFSQPLFDIFDIEETKEEGKGFGR